jgi:hypothetical protein
MSREPRIATKAVELEWQSNRAFSVFKRYQIAGFRRWQIL